MKKNCPVKISKLDFIIRIAGEGGDGLSTGCGHISPAARKNPDITYLILSTG